MEYELKPYQEYAVYDSVEGMLPNTLRFLNSPKHQRLYVLKSIMGSGKTIIASEFIEALLESDDPARAGKEICIIWLSKGNAGLHMQSSEKLKKTISSKDINIYGIMDSSDFNADRFFDKDVYVINWEKINNIDKETNELSNNLFIESENRNLRSAIRNSTDVEYIFIIDEFHMNYGTSSYDKIVAFFNPHVIIGMSATPSADQMAKADTKYFIPVADVMNEGMIKKGICFNTASDYSDDEISKYDSIDEFFLRLALRQRDILEQKYRAVGSKVIPLLLIQFNDDKTNEDIIKVKDILDRDYDYNRSGVYAIWISETDNKKDKLRSSDSIISSLNHNDVRILLFKQAVATGWDCPRAHVLLRYRRVVTRKEADAVSSFDVQTIGRIFRMPEPTFFVDKEYKHYPDEELNYGYVYVPNNGIELEKDFRQAYGADADNFPKKIVTVNYSSAGKKDSGDANIPAAENTAEAGLRDDGSGTCLPEDPELPGIPLPIAGHKDGYPSTGLYELHPRKNDERYIPSSPFSTGTQPVRTSGQKSIEDEFAEKFGPVVKRAEKILSEVNTVCKVHSPSVDEVNTKIKHIINGICIQRDIREDGYAEQIVFHGKTMSISDAMLDENAGVEFADTGSFSIHDTPAVLNSKAEKLLKDLVDKKQYAKETKEFLKKRIKLFFRKEVAGYDTIDEDSTAKTSRLILLNEAVIKEIIRHIDESIIVLKYNTFESVPFLFPNKFIIPPDPVPDSKGLMHIALPDTASEPEKIFESILNSLDNVLLWYKNQDHGSDAFCIPYIKRYNDRGKTIEKETPTYPDFIVMFKDESIGIYEIKDYDKPEDDNVSKALAISQTVNALNKMGYKTYGGLVNINKSTEAIQDKKQFVELL